MSEFRIRHVGFYLPPNDEKIQRILRNRCQCNVCKDIIESKSRHDFVQCKCGRIFTDGGLDYFHRGFTEPDDLIDLSEVQGFTLDTEQEG